MGFGLLLTGYLMTYLLSLSNYGAFPALIGSVIMLYALTKLIEYEPGFRYSFYAAAGAGVTWLVLAVIAFFGIISVPLPGFLSSEVFVAGVRYLKMFFDLCFHIALMLAVMKIAGDTGLNGIKSSAIVNLVLYGVFFASEVADSTITDGYADRMVFLTTVIIWLVSLAMNSVMIARCYMKICDEDDQDMKRKPTNIGFIDRFYEALDKKEEKARKRDAEYRKEKYEKKKSRRKKH